MSIQQYSIGSLFNLMSEKTITQASFAFDYCELSMQQQCLRFMSETVIHTPKGAFTLPSKEANWEFCQLIGKNIEGMEETEKNITINISDGYRVVVDILLEPPGDNFHIIIPGDDPVFT
jgi:hypothetical protein